MSSSTVINQHLASSVKLNWFFILAAILLICCSCINSNPADVDQLSEHQIIDNYYPDILFADELSLAERAAPRLGRASPRLGRASPRLGRASPRLGRASPRLGRRAIALMLSRLNHAGRYYNADDDIFSDDLNEAESSMQERAAPRLGRAIHVDEQQKKA